MKKVLVTGATGFIGRHALPLLKLKGYEVFAVTSKPVQNNTEGIHWIQWDLLGKAPIAELIAVVQPSHLLHFAWDATPGKFWQSMQNLQWVKASIDLVEAFAHQGGKRAVFAGTCAEYDWNFTHFEETSTPCLPQTLYGSSKLAMHLIVESLSKQMGFSQAWGRIFYLYGPHEYPQRFVSSVIRGLLQKLPVPCSHGNQLRDILHVRDVADAFVTLLDSEVEGAINIGSGTGVSLKDVIGQITAQLGEEELVQLGAFAAPKGDPVTLVATTHRLKDELGWSPSLTLEEGLRETISWWKTKV